MFSIFSDVPTEQITDGVPRPCRAAERMEVTHERFGAKAIPKASMGRQAPSLPNSPLIKLSYRDCHAFAHCSVVTLSRDGGQEAKA